MRGKRSCFHPCMDLMLVSVFRFDLHGFGTADTVLVMHQSALFVRPLQVRHVCTLT